MMKTSRRRIGPLKHLATGTLVGLIVLVGAPPMLAKEAKPLKIFILAGQSNMQGHAQVATFEAMRLRPETARLLKKMRGEDGQPRTCQRVWISSLGSAPEVRSGALTAGYGAAGRGPKIGPEFTFGITMEESLDQPVLIIKTAWGGKSLHTDFRPPSAPPFQFREEQLTQWEEQGKDVAAIKRQKQEATGHYYRLMLEHVREVLRDPSAVYPDYDAKAGHELAGFVWFQGWNDMVDGGVYPERGQPGGYALYSRLMATFIRDVRKDLQAPELPLVIGVMGVGGPTELYGARQQRYKQVHQNFRDAMAAPAELPEFENNVAVVRTERFWDQDVVRLREKEQPLQPKIKAIREAIRSGRQDRAAGEAAIEQLYADTFSDRELEILQGSTSNADFHYMGSAGIVGQIGEAFAQAILKLPSPKR